MRIKIKLIKTRFFFFPFWLWKQGGACYDVDEKTIYISPNHYLVKINGYDKVLTHELYHALYDMAYGTSEGFWNTFKEEKQAREFSKKMKNIFKFNPPSINSKKKNYPI